MDIDIETSSKFIECKNWYWQKSIDRIPGFKSKIVELRNIAVQEGKILEFHSKHIIPEEITKWLKEQNILFF